MLRPEALERASGAVDVLEKARIVQTWEEAVEGVEYLCASAMTARDFGPPTVRTPHLHNWRLPLVMWMRHCAVSAGVRL